MKIVISHRVHEDLSIGYHFYENQSGGIGDYFLDSLCAEIDSLVLYAGLHRSIGGYFRALSRRFPFAIYYKMENSEVQVHRVLDCRSNPTWIRQQLKRTDD